ncbi:DUF6624 domain-containing protein [Flavobacterium sp. GCM10027622]|uniref:DUF6624 domain-containing protein n=1 Tax=unclassified Flavobacterium TaxID=196869 RepID=UPI00361F9AC0
MKNLIFIVLVTTLLTSCSRKLTEEKKVYLQRKLEEMRKTDQIAANHWEKEWAKYKDSVFTTHKVQLEKMFKEYGFLGFDKVGKESSNNFWLIVQHCDKFPDFQKKILKAMDKEVKKKNANPNNYAYLFDRVETNAGRKQLFGTQLDYAVETTGRAFPKFGLIDSVNVDKIRKEYNLEPLKDYLNEVTTLHYEMNKEHYQKKGITKPDLY